MDLEQLANFVGISVPLITIAGTAVAYVYRMFSEARQRRRNEFFELVKLLDEEGTLATKMAAVYELRNFPEHREFIVRFLRLSIDHISGSSAQTLRYEFEACLEYFGAS